MRRVRPALPLLGLLAACGGSTDAASPKTQRAADKDFAEYAVAHGGIQTLAGGGDAPEVTADGLRLEALDRERPVKLDGVLGEWPAPTKAGVTARGNPKGGLRIGLQLDGGKLYVGADVRDASFEAGRDHVSLVLAVPTPGASYVTYELGLYAGNPGQSEGSVRLGRHGNVAGAKVVEAPGAGGYSIEAMIPLSALPELRVTRVGVHGVAQYVDGDGTLATGPGDAEHPRDMPWVPSEPELAMIEQLLGPKGLTRRAPDVELVADLTGDGVRERVAVWDRYLTICGTSYLGGKAFFFRELAGQLVKLEARDVTGRRGADVVVRRKQRVGEAEREYLEILSALTATDEPRVTFAHEIAVRQGDRHVDNAVHLGRGEIDVAVEPATRWDALSYREPIASDVEPILLPWGGVRSQSYRFDGAAFAKGKEVTQRETGPVVASGGTPERPPPHPPEPPTPKVARGGDLGAAVLEQYRKDRGVPADVAPKVDLRVQVAGGAEPERVLLVGRDIVVLGPGFKGGTGYSFLALQQFAGAGDISDMTARDLTGDGAADLVVRGVRHVTTDGAAVDEELMFVYALRGDAITRVFGIETAREQGGKRVQGLVQFVPGGGGKTFDVLSAPGRATGWTEKTYPWSQDPPGAAGASGVEPLLLPWGGIPSVRYTWSGTAFVKSGG